LVSPEPFSTLDPVKDLHLQGFSRTASSSPPRSIFGRLSEGIDRTRTPRMYFVFFSIFGIKVSRHILHLQSAHQ
jgi:hypothetical protein